MCLRAARFIDAPPGPTGRGILHSGPGTRPIRARAPGICCIRAAPPRSETPQTGDLRRGGVSRPSNVPIMAVP